ncbi:hypothetical protein [Iamia sp.]|jgi:hypothetical protein|uniref:hypothetical protein n=1 Tax=Iamia sp. TaxID=2722710 RepID=UPI002C90FA37|nr:hypothetical protein [Iamia sp.]HXH58736.1 hypothetical protein [Iamia sp.]
MDDADLPPDGAAPADPARDDPDPVAPPTGELPPEDPTPEDLVPDDDDPPDPNDSSLDRARHTSVGVEDPNIVGEAGPVDVEPGLETDDDAADGPGDGPGAVV